MKTAGSLYILVMVLCTGVLLLTGCSEISDDYQMPPAAEIKVHPQDFSNPGADGFHGRVLRDMDWNWDNCEQCHGAAPAFTGGISNVSCSESGCHMDFEGQPKTVATCNTCHGDFRAKATDFFSFAPPRDLNKNTATTAVGVGAHQIHLRGDISSTGIACQECHDVPARVFTDNHLTPSGPNKVVFGELTSFDTELVDMQANPPTYNPHAQTPSCSNTYCHGHFTGGNNYTPVWTVVDGSQAACGTCHGNPETGNPLPKTRAEGGRHPAGMQFLDCQMCHFKEAGFPIARRLEDGSWVIEQKDLHVNGKIYLFEEERTSF
jgi:predicted CxxxxCH...CXXCH cytochrome family protein